MSDHFWSVQNVSASMTTTLDVDLSAVAAIEHRRPSVKYPGLHVKDEVIAHFEAGGRLTLLELDMSNVTAQMAYAELHTAWRRARSHIENALAEKPPE